MHSEPSCREVDLGPAQPDELRDAQPMPVGHLNGECIAVAVAPPLLSGGHQSAELLEGQIFTLAAMLGIRAPTRRLRLNPLPVDSNCSQNSGWQGSHSSRVSAVSGLLDHVDCSHF